MDAKGWELEVLIGSFRPYFERLSRKFGMWIFTSPNVNAVRAPTSFRVRVDNFGGKKT